CAGSTTYCIGGNCTDAGAGGGSAGGGGGGSGSDGGLCPVPCAGTCCSAAQTCEIGQCKPACAASLRCGDGLAEVGCASAQVFYLSACIAPGPACASSSECAMAQYCDTAIGKCLPLAPGNNQCEFRSDGGMFNPVSQWKYQVTSDVYTQVM